MTRPSAKAEIAAGAAILVGVSALCYAVFSGLRHQNTWSSIWVYRSHFVSGWLWTVGISAAALVGSTVVGSLAMAGARSTLAAVRLASSGFIELIRGTPLLTQLLIGHYIVGTALGMESQFVNAILLLSLFEGAYIAEILRGGIESIGRSQIESARAVGFSRRQIYRYVIIPQAARRVAPSMAGAFANLIKDSSLLTVIAIPELTHRAYSVNAQTYGGVEAYAVLAVGYLILTLPIFAASRWLERRYRFDS